LFDNYKKAIWFVSKERRERAGGGRRGECGVCVKGMWGVGGGVQRR
jgi:hypothetical protein